MQRKSGNRHIKHVDELLYDGRFAVKKIYDIMSYVKNQLTGNVSVNSKYHTTLKYDGSVAIILGTDPDDGNFFVAKKSFFNKTPVLYKSFSDIDNSIDDPDLALKLKYAFKYLQGLNLSGIYQCDLLYIRPMLKLQDIDNTEYVTFHSNVLLYGIPKNSSLGREALNSKIGVVFHTKYEGSTFFALNANYHAQSIINIRSTPDVVVLPNQTSSTGFKFDADEMAQYNKCLNNLTRLYSKIDKDFLDNTVRHPEIHKLLLSFDNKMIKIGKSPDPRTRFQYLMDYMKSLKMPESIVSSVNNNRLSFQVLFEMYNTISKCKSILIKAFDRTSDIGTFLMTPRTIKKAEHEGLVVSDKTGTVVKIVNRNVFSHANFNADDNLYLRGWSKK